MLPLTVTAALGMVAAQNAIPAQPVNASMPGAQMGSALMNGQIPASGMVEVSGGKVFFKAEGKGTPMLLIHGYPLNGELFKNNRTALAAAGYQVITVDLPGFGKSMVNSSDASIEFMPAASSASWTLWG
ncbi:alpha/beta fold hydrolase [Deinococcus ruber]|nr:alpha/beta fold hydrolase [Deinococcus ruber]